MPRRKKNLLLLFATVALFLLAAIAIPHFKLKSKVARYRRSLAEAGEKLTVQALKPTPESATVSLLGIGYRPGMVPAAMFPVAPGRARVAWAQKDLAERAGPNATNLWEGLALLWPYQLTTIQRAREAAATPEISFDVDYNDGFRIPLAHLSALRGAEVLLSIGTLYTLHEGDFPEAFENWRAAVQLPAHYRGEALLVAQMLRSVLVGVAFATTWESLQFDGWTDAQLRSIQEVWEEIELGPGAEEALAMERAMTLHTYEAGRVSLINLDRLTGLQPGPANAVSNLADLSKQLVSSESIRRLADRIAGYPLWKYYWSYDEEYFHLKAFEDALGQIRQMQQIKKLIPARPHPRPPRAFGFRVAGDNFSLDHFINGVARADVQKNMAITALALRRFQMKHGTYPRTLEDLMPQFLARLPNDILSGQPLIYRARSSTNFLLYSVGLNRTDDHGDARPVDERRTRPAMTEGKDWVWPEPATEEEIKAREK